MHGGRRTLCLGLLALVLALGARGARALELTLPAAAELTGSEESPADTYALPVGPHDGETVPTRAVEGDVTRRAWRIEGAERTTLEVFAPLRDQLVENGHDILFECRDESCGGFDFRFGISVLPAPDVFVDLFDYRFLSARRAGGDSAEYVTVLVSRVGEAAYVQIITIGDAPVLDVSRPAAEDAEATTLIGRLLSQGHAVLSDLEFDTGADALAEGEYASLAALAAYLKADPARRIALVGHTDMVGGLEDNMALSHQRAASVRDRLVERHGVPAEQLEAHGTGYLAPVAPNTTAKGREANRRVEAVLLQTQ